MNPSAHSDTFARDNLPPADQWPVLILDGPDTPYPARMNTTTELLDNMVQSGRADSPVIHSEHGTLTFQQLAAKVNQICHVLRDDLGLVPGNRVLLRGANNPSMAACLLAVIKCGMVAVPTMPLLRAGELQKVIDKAQVKAALCDARLMDDMTAAKAHCKVMSELLAFNGDPADSGSLEHHVQGKSESALACDTAADDVALIAFTSGTTGNPKGTMHFHRDIIAMCDLFPRHVLKPSSHDVFCGTPPLAFTFGLGGMLCFSMRVGASTLLIERASPDSLLAAIAKHRATICFTAPTFYRQMAELAGNHDISSLRECVSAGEALPDTTRQQFKASTGIEIVDGIGATEMIHIFISSPSHQVKPGAIGQVVPGYQARVVGDDMQTLPIGEVGRLAVRGPTGCRYLDDERQLNYVRDGWNLTGDTFYMDEDEYFFYQARSDDMIVSAGYNIAGPEVEDALQSLTQVAECAVIGVADDQRGQIVKAFVVLNKDQHASEALKKTLQDAVKAKIAPYKYPRAIEFLETLPRTETGKLQRFKLRA